MVTPKQLLPLLFVFSLFLAMPIGAVEDVSTDQEKANLLRKEVEAILAETDDQSSDRLLVKRAFCGNLIAHRKDDQELSIDVRGEEKLASYDDDATMIGINREGISPADLEIGNYLVAMGYLDRLEPDKLAIKRLVVQETPALAVRESFFGLVGDISSEEEVFILTHDGLVFEVLAKGAKLSYREDDKITTAKFSRLEEQDRVVVVGQRKDDNGRIEATKIHIVSSGFADPQE
ncbi:MAG: hypothetical protein PHR64_01700 [Candidatus Shapirobacteria bacterium]|nr:hypothetical protein [Candidatus Shapirobacteria bacterium]MDD5073756.1 hypothetical protein [Candidatus Shapirobacteria bacterium]MDD5481643.1 hypothetical protein [Candidatus Shapirobacteria bacterium]